jgi:hypothetical protein
MRDFVSQGAIACSGVEICDDPLPPEWHVLRERVASLPIEARAELEPVVDEALEHARFRERVLGLAREAIEQFRIERLMLEFDLESTRREGEELRRRLEWEFE